MKSKLLLLSLVAVSLVASFFTVSALKNQQETRSKAAEGAVPSPTQGDDVFSEPAYPSDAFEVRVKNGKFAPSPATIKISTPIVFENLDKTDVTIVADGGLQIVLKPGQKSEPTFFKIPAVYNYSLQSNPQAKGVVKVIK